MYSVVRDEFRDAFIVRSDEDYAWIEQDVHNTWTAQVQADSHYAPCLRFRTFRAAMAWAVATVNALNFHEMTRESAREIDAVDDEDPEVLR